MASSFEMRLPDGRLLRAHDSGDAGGTTALTLLWHHGSPQSGELLEPVLAAATARDIRLVAYARPSYGGSSPNRGRSVASAADDVARVVDDLGIERFAVMGASGGGPHALACAARLPGRVIAAVTLAGMAPFATDVDWYAGMVAPGGLRAAEAGRAVRERYAETDEFDPSSFTASDWAALEGGWAALGADAGRAGTEWPEGLVDDDLAYVAPWGFDPADVRVPVWVIHGGEDRVIPASHAHWLLDRIDTAELWLRPRDGHVSVLDAVPVAMDWLLDRAA
jgi:pimeloyl-ACP methyl ester carboxylesterase